MAAAVRLLAAATRPVVEASLEHRNPSKLNSQVNPGKRQETGFRGPKPHITPSRRFAGLIICIPVYKKMKTQVTRNEVLTWPSLKAEAARPCSSRTLVAANNNNNTL